MLFLHKMLILQFKIFPNIHLFCQYPDKTTKIYFLTESSMVFKMLSPWFGYQGDCHQNTEKEEVNLTAS